METKYKPVAPPQRKGFNRDAMINDCQTKFQFAKAENAMMGGMIKRAPLSSLEAQN